MSVLPSAVCSRYCISAHHRFHYRHLSVGGCALLLSATLSPQHLGGVRGALGPEEVRSPALSLLSGALESVSPLLRCLAAEGLARLLQVVGDAGFTVSVSLLCFDRYDNANMLLLFLLPLLQVLLLRVLLLLQLASQTLYPDCPG